MRERIEELRSLVEENYPSSKKGSFFDKLLDVISDLIHKVEEFEPEDITMDDVNKYYDEENRDLLYESTKRQSLLQEAIERDKLAKELVEGILNNSGSLDRGVMELAIQLKEKLDDK